MWEFVKVFWFVNKMFKIAVIMILIFSSQVYAKKTGTLKLGGGISYISLPEYIGSSVQKNYILPYPYVYYKSDNITIKKNMLFGHIYNKENFTIDLSMSGTLPVKSDSASLRYGMRQLDPTLELGPNFVYKLYTFNDKKSSISVKLPIRAVFSIDFPSAKNIGYIANPNFYLSHKIKENLKLELSTGPTYATKKYYDYFYKVDASDATLNRTVYDGKSGFGGWKTTTGFSYEKNSILFGAFVRYYDLKNAVFLNSPLVDENNALFYGMALRYIF